MVHVSYTARAGLRPVASELADGDIQRRFVMTRIVQGLLALLQMTYDGLYAWHAHDSIRHHPHVVSLHYSRPARLLPSLARSRVRPVQNRGCLEFNHFHCALQGCLALLFRGRQGTTETVNTDGGCCSGLGCCDVPVQQKVDKKAAVYKTEQFSAV